MSNTTETFRSTFPAGREYRVENKLKQINKRAKRLKLKPLTLEVSKPFKGTWSRIIEGPYGAPVESPYECNLVTATVTCEQEIKLEGDHELLAVFENINNNAMITSLVEGEDFSEYREGKKAFVCDHCGHKRSRKKTVLIKKDGEEMVIGTSCIRDFLGYDPSLTLFSAGMIADAREQFGDDEELLGRGGNARSVSFEDTVKLSLHVLAGNNWKYEKFTDIGCNLYSTADSVDLLIGEGGFTKALAKIFKYEELAEKAMEYFKGLNEAFLSQERALSDYDYKIAVLVGAGYIELKYIKMVAGAVASYIRKNRIAETIERGVSEHIGNIGDKVEMELEVTRIHTFMDYSYNYHGNEKTIVSGFVNGKDKFTWFTSPATAEKAGMTTIENGLEVPAKGLLKVKGTVKAHKDDQYGISTVFTRVSKVKAKK